LTGSAGGAGGPRGVPESPGGAGHEVRRTDGTVLRSTGGFARALRLRGSCSCGSCANAACGCARGCASPGPRCPSGGRARRGPAGGAAVPGGGPGGGGGRGRGGGVG